MILEKTEIGINFYFERNSSIVFLFIHLKTLLFSPALSGLNDTFFGKERLRIQLCYCKVKVTILIAATHGIGLSFDLRHSVNYS